MNRRLSFEAVVLVAMGLFACGGSSAGPPAIVTLGSAGNEPNGMAVNGKDVYWASVDWRSDAGPSGTGSVQRVSIDGGAVDIVGTGVLPYAVAVDATSVYWTENPASDQSQILRAPRAGGAPAVLYTGGSVTTGIALDDQGSLYWGSRQQGMGAALLKMPAGGGSPVVLATSPSANAACPSGCIAVDATSVYWVPSGPGPLLKVPRAGGSPVSLASTQGASSLAVAARGVYWMDAAAIRTVGLDGGAVRTIASVKYGVAIAVDSANVYWTATTDTTILVEKAPLAGGGPSTLATFPVRGLGPPTAIALDDTSVYIAMTLPGCTLGCATVQKITPK
jgi:hypothetical protein